MKQLLNSGTVSIWSTGHGAEQHPVLLDYSRGGGARICVRPGPSPVPLSESSIHRNYIELPFGRIRQGVGGYSVARTEPLMDEVRMEVHEGVEIPPFNFNRELFASDSMSWLCHLAALMSFQGDTCMYQLRLTRRRVCGYYLPLCVQLGTLWHFATHGAGFEIMKGEEPLAPSKKWRERSGQFIFFPGDEPITLITSKGCVEFLALSGFDGFLIKEDDRRGSIVVSPVLRISKYLKPGEQVTVSASIRYTPHA